MPGTKYPWLFGLVCLACRQAPEQQTTQPTPRTSSLEAPLDRPTASAAGSSARTPSSDSADPSAEAPSEAGFTGSVGILEERREGYPTLLTAVRAAKHELFDRTVFEFAEGIPGYHLEYVDHPVRDCGAGETRVIAGDAWLEVRLYPANAHTEAGKPTIPERELLPKLPVVLEIERTCDFEAVVTWVLGVSSPNRYRVLELASPARLVVDILH